MIRIYVWGNNDNVKINKKFHNTSDEKFYGDGELGKFIKELKLKDKQHIIQIWNKS